MAEQQHPRNNCSNLPPFDSPEWHAMVAAEEASRPVARIDRNASWRPPAPKSATPETPDTLTVKSLHWEGTPKKTAQTIVRLAERLDELAARLECMDATLATALRHIDALEAAARNSGMPDSLTVQGVEKRGKSKTNQ